MSGHFLRKAAAKGNLNFVTQLYWEGISLNEADPENKKTALHHAAEFGHLAVLEYLLSRRVKIDSQDIHGNTPLNTAIQADLPLSKKIELIQCFMQAKTNPFLQNIERRSPLINLCEIAENPTLMHQPNLKNALQAIIRDIKSLHDEQATEHQVSPAI